MSDLPSHVERSIRDRGLLVRSQRLLVAVSGGVDSMVLMQVLHGLAPSHGWQLTVAHLNHALRGRSSDADERLVRRTAEKLKLPVQVERADVRRFARMQGFSLEMAARKIRHEFLARTAAQLAIPSIALAHQADDQVELFFLRLLRGSSGEGLGGMRWRSPSPANREIELVRPLLDQPRSVLLAYAAETGIRFREDASNASMDFQRNRIRQELLPLIQAKYQPALSKIILRNMDVLSAEAEFAAQAASAWLDRQRKGKQLGSGWVDSSMPFEKLPIAVQRRIIQAQLLGQGIVADYSLIEELRSTSGRPVTIGPVQPAIEDDRSQRVGSTRQPDLAERVDRSGATYATFPAAAFRDRAGIVHLQYPKLHAFKFESMRLTLGARVGQARFAGATLKWQISRQRPAFPLRPVKGGESFDADKVGPAVLLRHWQPGDRFQPIGMAQPVKLQNFFTNQKLPLVRRRQLIIAATAKGEVFWVEGMRISERFKLSKGTIRRLQWRWKRP